jgi:hypothetical protein
MEQKLLECSRLKYWLNKINCCFQLSVCLSVCTHEQTPERFNELSLNLINWKYDWIFYIYMPKLFKSDKLWALYTTFVANPNFKHYVTPWIFTWSEKVRDWHCTEWNASSYTAPPSLSSHERLWQDFPVPYFELQPPFIQRHKLRRIKSGVISGFQCTYFTSITLFLNITYFVIIENIWVKMKKMFHYVYVS